jgi:hypothetical protein
MSCSPSHTEHLKRPANSDGNTAHDQVTSVPKRASESIDVFCKLKERRLQDFYREQMTIELRSGGNVTQTKEDEVASDLTTKSSQTQVRSPHSNSARNSHSECQNVTSSPLTMSLQQKLKPLPESKLSNCDEKLSYTENVKKDDKKNVTENCDTEANSIEINSEQNNSVSIDDKNLQVTVTKRLEHERKDEGHGFVQGDVQILHDTRRTIFTKNDNNNNNNNGELNFLIIFSAIKITIL